jgi:hypothetical protein
MNFLRKPLLMLLPLLGGLAVLLFELNRPGMELRKPTPLADGHLSSAPPELLVQLETLRAEKEASSTKMAALEAEVRQLKRELTGRAEASGERALKQQPHPARGGGGTGTPDRQAPEETPFSKSVLELAVKAGRLNAQIQQHPQWDIPELQYVDEGEWIHFAKEADLDSEAGVSKALSELRKTAKSRFADLAREALASYSRSNGGQPPSNVNQLTPYLPDSVSVALLERYQLIPANSPQRPASADIGGPMILREKASVDPLYDTSFDIGPVGWTALSTGTGYVIKQVRQP